jgi:hypothetical protein
VFLKKRSSLVIFFEKFEALTTGILVKFFASSNLWKGI